MSQMDTKLGFDSDSPDLWFTVLSMAYHSALILKIYYAQGLTTLTLQIPEKQSSSVEGKLPCSASEAGKFHSI